MNARRFFTGRFWAPRFFPATAPTPPSGRGFFPHRYFADRFWPPRFFPASALPVGTGRGYFPSRYFARRYFPSHFFPGPPGGSIASVTPTRFASIARVSGVSPYRSSAEPR